MKWRNTTVLFLVLLLVGGVAYWQGQRAVEVPAPPATAQSVRQAGEPLFPDVAVADVARLEIERPGTGAHKVFVREGDGWVQRVPTSTEILSPTILLPLRSLLAAESRRTLPATAGPPADYGLDEPAATIMVAVRREGVLVRRTLAIGNETPAGDAYYLQQQGRSQIHVVATFAINNVLDLLSQ